MSGHSAIDIFGQNDMSILVVVVGILVRVLNFVGVVGHRYEF